jgi:ABC-2 type transport system permease protein
MSPHRTAATTRRVLTQLRHEPPTLIQIVIGPCLLLTLFRLIFAHRKTAFDQIGAPLLAIFPLITIYQATSVALLRERISGTLERLMTTPLGRLELLFGYAGAFALTAVAQAAVASAVILGLLGLSVAGSYLLLVLVAVSIGLLGTGLGLLVSSVVRSELQVTQSMVLIVIPQILLSGLIEPRQTMPVGLHDLSDVLPLSYAVDAMHHLTRQASAGAAMIGDLFIILGFAVAALVAGAASLRRQTG